MKCNIEDSSPSSQANLYRQVAERIGTFIGNGRLVPGSVLPNEVVLGNEFGVSRTALREAIKVLAAKGLVEVRRKTGTRVRPHDEWNVLDPEVLSWMFAGGGLTMGIVDLLEVRKLVEPDAAKMAAERVSAADLAEIGAAYAAMETAAEDLPSSIEPDLRFHLGILKATHNIFMRPFGGLIQATLRASFQVTNSSSTLYRKTLGLHRNVLNAIELRNGDQAKDAMLVLLALTSEDINARLLVTTAKPAVWRIQRRASER